MRIPDYQVRREGPDHIPRFTARVRVGDGVEERVYYGSTSSTTKTAEHEVVMVALVSLNAPAAADSDGAAAAADPDGAAAVTLPVSHECMLQKLCQRHKLRMPRYDWMKGGPDHDPIFRGSVFVSGFTFVSPNYRTSIKSAEDGPAEHALDYFKYHPVGGATFLRVRCLLL